jgi:hypothetical protein
MERKRWTGGCMCGSVRFGASGQPDWVAMCHCASCRRHTGGILNGAAGFKNDDVRIDGEPAVCRSSPGVRRYFCASCGTSLAYRSDNWPEDIHLFLGTFYNAPDLYPQFHIFAQERLVWLCLCDDLPRYRTTPSSGETVVK